MHRALIAPLTLLLALAPQAWAQDAAPPDTAAPPDAAAPSAQDFSAQRDEVERVLGLVVSGNSALLLKGDMAEATRRLLTAAPPVGRTAAEAFVLGGLLFPLDFEQSYRLHEEAFAKAPQEPEVIEAWAVEQHRAGHFAEAEALYTELLALGLGDAAESRLNALRADCLLRLERPEEACDAWRAVDVIEFHPDVVEAAARVYTPVSPETRRCALLQKASASPGDPSAFDDLLLLDLHWDKDVWSSDVRAEYAAHDLALAQAALGADNVRFKSLAFLARWTFPGRRLDFDGDIPKLQPPADNTEAIAADARELKVLGSLSKLPENGRLMGFIFQVLVDNSVASTEELLDWHGVELRRRGKSSQGDIEAMRVLANLYEQTWSDELDEWQRLGWSRYGDVDCAIGLLERQRDKLRSRDLVLVQALSEHPGDVRLARLAAEAAAHEGDLLVGPLSRQIAADFARMDDCQPVTLGFRKLEAALSDRK